MLTKIYAMKNLIKIAVPMLLLAITFSSYTSPNPMEWHSTEYFDVETGGYLFNKVVAENLPEDPCKIKVTLFYNSTTYDYTRFRVKVTLMDGAWIRTPVFYDNATGDRQYSYTHDSGSQDCWGEDPNGPTYLNVTWCKGRDCDPAAID